MAGFGAATFAVPFLPAEERIESAAEEKDSHQEKDSKMGPVFRRAVCTTKTKPPHSNDPRVETSREEPTPKNTK